MGLYANEWLEDTDCHAEVGCQVAKVKVLAPHEYTVAPCCKVLAGCILSIIKTIKSTFNNYQYMTIISQEGCSQYNTEHSWLYYIAEMFIGQMLVAFGE